MKHEAEFILIRTITTKNAHNKKKTRENKNRVSQKDNT